MPPIFLGSEIYRNSSYGAWHPLRIPRVTTVMDLARALGWFAPGTYRASPRAKPAALALWHTEPYLAALMEAERRQSVSAEVRARHGLGTASNPVYPEMYRRPATAAGAGFLAAALLQRPGIVHSPGGGTHHGLPDRANGFCYLNDPVLTILAMRARGLGRVAYVDIDAHHCDGVELAFRDEPDVLVISVHEENRWPRSGAIGERGIGNVFNLPVPAGLHDDEMALIRDALIARQVAAFAPDAIVLQCGADAIEEDPLSRLALGNGAHIGVLRALRPLAPRLLVLGGGGYNPWSVGRLWTRLWGEMAGAPLPPRLPARGEAVLRALAWPGHRHGRAPAPHWFTTLADSHRGGPIRPEIRARLSGFAAASV